jgi:hypothetical protein
VTSEGRISPSASPTSQFAASGEPVEIARSNLIPVVGERLAQRPDVVFLVSRGSKPGDEAIEVSRLHLVDVVRRGGRRLTNSQRLDLAANDDVEDLRYAFWLDWRRGPDWSIASCGIHGFDFQARTRGRCFGSCRVPL